MAGRSIRELDCVPELMEQTLLTTAPQVESIVASINLWNNIYCLGYGATYPMALEGALKLKEITYAHCEGMLSTEFKHGPLSAITGDFPVIFVVTSRDIPLNEITCRGGRAIVIGPDDDR